MRAAINMVGKIFGEWTVEEYSHIDKNHHHRFKVKCSCSRRFVITGWSLRAGTTTRCKPCSNELRKITRIRHGKSYSREYCTWASMVQRCSNPNHKNWDKYGGRGLTVCDRWRKFENFYADMGERPPGRTLDRIDNNKGYFPDNCRWATPTEQTLNKRGCSVCNCECRMKQGALKKESSSEYRSTNPPQSLQAEGIPAPVL